MEKTELRIHTWPEKILRTKCRRVEVVDENIKKLLDEMCFLMRSRKGVGLAANQAGIDLCLAVIEAEDRIFKLVNPCIIKKNGKISISEGCLSFPGLELEIKRAKKVWVRSLNEKGEPQDLEVEGVLAIIFQHELDHLDGICFINRIPFWQRLRILKKLRAIKKETKNGLRKQS